MCIDELPLPITGNYKSFALSLDKPYHSLTKKYLGSGKVCPNCSCQKHTSPNEDSFSRQNLVGYPGMQVINYSLAKTTEDAQQTHQVESPVDNANW